MQGEYRGDFTRDTFRRANHFCRVLMQQGRVQLDADWNEQTAILLDFLRGLARDVIGWHGGPDDGSFEIEAALDPNGNPTGDLAIGAGHYYVDGILCELAAPPPNPTGPDPAPLTLKAQPDWPGATLPANASYLIYLDVWERHVTAAQQDSIRETALGGPDTASRAKIIWQVKTETNLFNISSGPALNKEMDSEKKWAKWTSLWQPPNRGRLKARLQPQQTSTDPCVISPQSTYRGTENQLYRVEIHDSGVLGKATYKWSRENGSVVFPILKLAAANGKTSAKLANLGRDPRLSLKVNDWVEVVDDVSSLVGPVNALLKVVHVEGSTQTVTLDGVSGGLQPGKHPLLRRWEGQGQVAEDANNWVNLEDGLQIQFQPVVAAANALGAQYRAGDYWLIPARVGLGTADGIIEWPQQTDAQGNASAAALPPHGIEHHYAPLACSFFDAPSGKSTLFTLRRTFDPLAQ
jgi:Family of unknown function (DUF6519)